MKRSREKDREKPAKHHELALGEIDYFGHAVNDIVTDCHHGVDRADSQATYDVLQKIGAQFLLRPEAVPPGLRDSRRKPLELTGSDSKCGMFSYRCRRASAEHRPAR